MGLFDFLKRGRRRDPVEEWRERLLAKGRITEGEIIDTELQDDGEELVRYTYSVQGVEFESCDVLNTEQKSQQIKYAPGAKVSIRYDPTNHGNAVIV